MGGSQTYLFFCHRCRGISKKDLWILIRKSANVDYTDNLDFAVTFLDNPASTMYVILLPDSTLVLFTILDFIRVFFIILDFIRVFFIILDSIRVLCGFLISDASR